MKRRIRSASGATASSRPAWGAWIETYVEPKEGAEVESRPAWGAWIETPP
ncbi:hypothetical protein HMPREF9163_02249 [Selenomonas sp. oral taxon 138 str. F0429]|nr:hypothetical protein HMPREF9163_02249 [Selenomonas sp. oral taxon 138 str. F0429]